MRREPALPPNIKIGQLRRKVGIIPQEQWGALNGDERDAANALSHLWWRSVRNVIQPSKTTTASS